MSDLALFGGKPVVKDHTKLRINWPITTKNDFLAIKRVFKNKDFSGRGSEEVLKFEKEFSSYYNGMYATALSNGTAAIHTALLALGVGPADEVIVPSLTFGSTAYAVLHNQSIPVFADIDPVSYNISPKSIEEKITKRTKAVIIVHLHGYPCDMDKIIKICKKYKLKLIEDVAQAPGALYKNKKLGTFGDASIFSLMSQKNLATCGECGMLLTKTLNQKNRAEMIRIYGEILTTKSRAYNSYTLGWNYTLNPIQAAMASVQFKKLETLTKQIQKNGRKLNNELSKFKWINPPVEENNLTSVFHFYRFRLNSSAVGFKDSGRFRKAIQDCLNAEGLNVRHYQNTPVPGQYIFTHKHGIGKGLPWSLSDKKYNYAIKDYPNCLDVLRSTLVLGAISSTPAYLLKKGTVEKYIKGFKKIDKNMNRVLEYAKKLEYKEPWDEIPVTSDSFKAKYNLFK